MVAVLVARVAELRVNVAGKGKKQIVVGMFDNIFRLIKEVFLNRTFYWKSLIGTFFLILVDNRVRIIISAGVVLVEVSTIGTALLKVEPRIAPAAQQNTPRSINRIFLKPFTR